MLLYANWCGFCRVSMPTFREHVDTLGGEVYAADISSYEDPRWELHDVDTVPALVAFDQGRILARADARLGSSLTAQQIQGLAARLAR